MNKLVQKLDLAESSMNFDRSARRVEWVSADYYEIYRKLDDLYLLVLSITIAVYVALGVLFCFVIHKVRASFCRPTRFTFGSRNASVIQTSASARASKDESSSLLQHANAQPPTNPSFTVSPTIFVKPPSTATPPNHNHQNNGSSSKRPAVANGHVVTATGHNHNTHHHHHHAGQQQQQHNQHQQHRLSVQPTSHSAVAALQQQSPMPRSYTQIISEMDAQCCN